MVQKISLQLNVCIYKNNWLYLYVVVRINYHICVAEGEGYIGRSIPVNVSAGIAMQSFAIKIIDDKIVECDETFNVTVMSVMTSCGVTIESNTISEVMIRDDDS